MAKKKHTTRNIYYLSVILYKVLYEYIYVAYGSKIYSYSGLVLQPSINKCIVTYIFFFLILILVPKDYRRVSTYLLNIFLLFTIVPILSFCWQADESLTYTGMCCISFAVLCIFCKVNIMSRTRINLLMDLRLEYVLFIIIAITIMLFTAKYGFADIRALDFSNVYIIRGERTYDGIWNYIISWLPKSIVPCLLCISLYHNKKYMVVFAIMAQFYLYLFTANKTVLFSVFLILITYVFIKKVEEKKLFLPLWSLTLSFMIIVSSVLYAMLDINSAFSIVPNRLLSIPAHISFNHYDFFAVNPKLNFSENMIGRILGWKSPYSEFSTFLVSNSGANANTGYLGDAFDNGGFLAMMIYSLIIAIILILIDSFTKKNQQILPVIVSVLTYTMINLNDTSLTATFITGGMLFNMIILYLFVSQESMRSNLRSRGPTSIAHHK